MFVSLIVPAYNEAENLPPLLAEIFEHLPPDIRIEIIIVDDNSPDGTGAVAEKLSGTYPVAVIHRPGKLGLGSAVREGFRSARGEALGVMDADLSHDPAILPRLFSALSASDIAVGSRFLSESQVDDWPFRRKLISRIGGWLARRIAKRPVADPLSGYFFLRRSVVEGVPLSADGYKILFEILCKGAYTSVEEVPFHFRKREHSASKLNFKEHWLFFKQLLAYARTPRG